MKLEISDNSRPIPLIYISSDVMEKVVVWLKYHYLRNKGKDGKQYEEIDD